MQANVHINGQAVTLEGAADATLLDALRGSGLLQRQARLRHGRVRKLRGPVGRQADQLVPRAARAGRWVLHPDRRGAGRGRAAGLEADGRAAPACSRHSSSWARSSAVTARRQCCWRARNCSTARGTTRADPEPISEAEAREALSGILCRCTGYVKPVAGDSQDGGPPAWGGATRGAASAARQPEDGAGRPGVQSIFR